MEQPAQLDKAPTARSRLRWPLLFYVYLALTRVFEGRIHAFARKRHQRMGAPAERFGERTGQATTARPAGKLVWFNAASLGELRAAATVIERLSGVRVLLTTTTNSGALAAARTLPSTVIHQFAPVDGPASVARFLDHWRPDMAVFVESDLPLRAIDGLARGGVPMAILNARPSKSRSRFPRLSRSVLSRMDLVTAQDSQTATELQKLGLEDDRLFAVLDLKSCAPAPKPDVAAAKALSSAIGGRPVWLAMSAHVSELECLTAAHRAVLRADPEALLIIAPRHPEKWADASGGAMGPLSGLTVASRSKAEALTGRQVYVADTLGEAGTLFAVSDVCVICGTFAQIGGHSPYEAFLSGRPVIYGPYPGNHKAAFDAAATSGAARQVRGAEDLAAAVLDWWQGDALAQASESAQSLSRIASDGAARIAARIKELIR